MSARKQNKLELRDIIPNAPALGITTCLCLLPGKSFAYLDPGTGSLLIQSTIAIIAGAMFGLKTYWFRIKMFFASRKSDAFENADKASEAREKTLDD